MPAIHFKVMLLPLPDAPSMPVTPLSVWRSTLREKSFSFFVMEMSSAISPPASLIHFPGTDFVHDPQDDKGDEDDDGRPHEDEHEDEYEDEPQQVPPETNEEALEDEHEEVSDEAPDDVPQKITARPISSDIQEIISNVYDITRILLIKQNKGILGRAISLGSGLSGMLDSIFGQSNNVIMGSGGRFLFGKRSVKNTRERTRVLNRIELLQRYGENVYVVPPEYVKKRSDVSENTFNSETGKLTLVQPCDTLDFVSGDIHEIVADDSFVCFSSNSIRVQRQSLSSLPMRIMGGDMYETFRQSSFSTDLYLVLPSGTYTSVFQECDFNGHSVTLEITGDVTLDKMFDQTMNLKSLTINGGRIHSCQQLCSCSKELESLKISSQFFGTVNFKRMCFCCKSLKECDFSNSQFELYNGNFEGMFFCCKSLNNCNMGHNPVVCTEHPNVSFMYSFNTGTMMDDYFDFTNVFKFYSTEETPITPPSTENTWFQKHNDKVAQCNSYGIITEYTDLEIWLPYTFDTDAEGTRYSSIDFKPFVNQSSIKKHSPMIFEHDEEKERNVFRNIDEDRYRIEHYTGIPVDWMNDNNDYPM